MQELWSIKLDWDATLPERVQTKWITFARQLQKLSKTSFPLWAGVESQSTKEIHGFCDASQQAIAAAIYIRIKNDSGESQTQLLCSKTKVAPLKKLTIPRLELAGALLVTKLTSHVIKVLELNSVPIFLWTDSAIVLTWINNHASRWKDYIQNRVLSIQDELPQATWNFVAGADNPADYATRGLTPSQLSQSSEWWTGPSWLAQLQSTWPKRLSATITKGNLEERPSQVMTTSSNNRTLWNLIHAYSTLTRLLRITALCQIFIARLRKLQNYTIGTLITPKELARASKYWIKEVQQLSFHQDLQLISKEKSLPKSSPLIRLTPFLDESGILRVGGRLQASTMPSAFKHPAILPKDSVLTKLIISDAHTRTLRGGTQVTLAFIRNTYWIQGGRTPVRSFILKCVICARYRQKRAQQLMGQLPASRVTSSRPFLNSGVDYAGPLSLKFWSGRSSRTYKAYVALFVCHSTSAVHLELVTDYTSQAFLAAFKRFTARRGICTTITSDCGTNIKGAEAELQRLFSAASKSMNHLASLLANDGTLWKFNPPGAPHFGGQWEAAVKSTKHHLRRVIGERILTYEEMTTLLTQIEAILNSRPYAQ